MENRNYLQQIQNLQMPNLGDGRRMEMAAVTQMQFHSRQQPARRCPRCQSDNTKFCYFNNYSLTQPRYFCKGCRRYWTHGGTLRNIPVGGAPRKAKRPRIPPSPPSPAVVVPQPPPLPAAGNAASVFAPTQLPAQGGVGGAGSVGFYAPMNLEPPVGPNVGFLQGNEFGRDVRTWQQGFVGGGDNGNAAAPVTAEVRAGAHYWNLGGDGASSSGSMQGCGRGGRPSFYLNDWPAFPAAGGGGADESA